MRIAIFSVIMLLGMSAFAQPYDDHHMGWNMHGYGVGGFLMWLLLIVLIGVVVYFIIRQQNIGKSETTGETPLEILKKRYAKGEISREEYERMKNDLS
jgi:putative membrane protein